MNEGAIDFRKLLKEEKKKARIRQQQQQQKQEQQQQRRDMIEKLAEDSHNGNAQQSLPQPNNGNDSSHNPITNNIVEPQQKYSIHEEDVEAIDFDKLLQKEKERALQRQQEQSMAESWSIPPNVFDRTHQLVCSQPPSIYYVSNFVPLACDQQALMEWLQSLPDNPRGTSKETTTDNYDEQSHNGAWTAMHYAKRRVALFDARVATKANKTLQSTAGSNNDNTSKNDNATPGFPAPLQRLVDAFVAQGIFPPSEAPNHILVNEYHPGQGILPHTDGPAYVSRTATLSLGSDVLIQFTPRPNYDKDTVTTNHIDNNKDETAAPKQQLQFCLEKGSLLVFEDSAYLDYCHGIADRVLEETVSEDCLNVPSSVAGTTVQRGYRISLTFRHKLHQT